MNLDKFKVFINNIKNLASDPEKFLTSKYQRRYIPNSFRIELYTARKYNLITSKLKWLKRTNPKATSVITEPKRSKVRTAYFLSKRHTEKTFCPYCEKAVVPKRLHKLDFADIIIILLTAGLWSIFLFIMYLFLRRCPICNYNLRGFKFISQKKGR
jgi:uncharacterized protein with PIN domain